MSKTPHTVAPADEDAELVARMVEIANRDDTTGLAADALREGSERLASKGADDGLREALAEAKVCIEAAIAAYVFDEPTQKLLYATHEKLEALTPLEATGSEPQ